jgi:hypothetical protein
MLPWYDREEVYTCQHDTGFMPINTQWLSVDVSFGFGLGRMAHRLSGLKHKS